MASHDLADLELPDFGGSEDESNRDSIIKEKMESGSQENEQALGNVLDDIMTRGFQKAMQDRIRIEDVDLKDKRVLLRANLNSCRRPTDKARDVDTSLILAVVPTIKYCLDAGCKSVVIASHFGLPPHGKVVPIWSLEGMVKPITNCLGKNVQFLPDTFGNYREKAVIRCCDPTPGTVFLLENLQFALAECGRGRDVGNNPVEGSDIDKSILRSTLRSMADIHCNNAYAKEFLRWTSMTGAKFDVQCIGDVVQRKLHNDRGKAQGDAAEGVAPPWRSVRGKALGNGTARVETGSHGSKRVSTAKPRAALKSREACETRDSAQAVAEGGGKDPTKRKETSAERRARRATKIEKKDPLPVCREQKIDNGPLAVPAPVTPDAIRKAPASESTMSAAEWKEKYYVGCYVGDKTLPGDWFERVSKKERPGKKYMIGPSCGQWSWSG